MITAAAAIVLNERDRLVRGPASLREVGRAIYVDNGSTDGVSIPVPKGSDTRRDIGQFLDLTMPWRVCFSYS